MSDKMRTHTDGRNTILQQDLTIKENPPGSVLVIHLFMEEQCSMPAKNTMFSAMERKYEDVDCITYSESMAGFAVKKYVSRFKDANVSPQLMITDCMSAEDFTIDDIAMSQMWDCPDSKEIFSKCRYRVCAMDMLTAGMEYKEKARLIVDFVDVLLELYPECKAVYFENSGKMLSRKSIVNSQMPPDRRFIYYAVNVRYFNILGGNSMLIDSLGMSTLFLPDVQFHFHGMDPNPVFSYAYNLLSYIYDTNCLIESGDKIDGIKEGKISPNVQWECRYEDALVQPVRLVLDVHMGEYASGKRAD